MFYQGHYNLKGKDGQHLTQKGKHLGCMTLLQAASAHIYSMAGPQGTYTDNLGLNNTGLQQRRINFFGLYGL